MQNSLNTSISIKLNTWKVFENLQGCSKIKYIAPGKALPVSFFLIGGPIFWKLNYTDCPLFEKIEIMDGPI